ncbi:MAG: hypothetical protein ACRC4W_06840 [Treponemataceae bacterium]
MKKAISFLFIIGCAGFAFYFGYLQLHVPINSYGVLVSKTSGVFEKPIIKGDFLWRWEPLIPTNAQIRLFNTSPQQFSFEVKGELPSSKLYTDILAGQSLNEQSDFDYEIIFTADVSINPEQLPSLIEKNGMIDQNSMDSFLKTHAQHLSKTFEEEFVNSFLIDDNFVFDDFLDQLSLQSKYTSLNIADANIQIKKAPNKELYVFAKTLYESYTQRRKESIELITKEQSELSAEDFFKIARYEQWGKILTEYPILIDFLAVSREDAAEVLKNLNAARGKKQITQN